MMRHGHDDAATDPQERGGASVDSSPIGTAKRHLRDCMDSPDYPVHVCYATCNDLAYLLADLAQARAETDDLVANAWDAAKAGIDQLTQERDQARAEIERLRQLQTAIKAEYEFQARESDQLRAQIQAKQRVVKAAREFMTHHLIGQPRTQGTLYPMTIGQEEQWHAEWDRRLDQLFAALAES